MSDTQLCSCGSLLKIITKRHLNSTKHLSSSLLKSNDKNSDEYQLKFINSNIEDSIVIGNPGCGKTKTIIDYCIYKYKEKKINSSNDFLILTFSKKAQLDFISKGRNSEIITLFSNRNVKTFHSFATYIFNKLNKKITTKSVNIIILATYKLLLNLLTVEDLLKICSYKFIVIDEAQDINENQYNLIKYISNKLKIPLILVGDPNQNIYQFQGGHDKYLLNHSNIKYNLINNYRSTNQIVNFLNYLRPHNNFDAIISKKNTNNTKPLIYCNNLNNILKHIKKELLNNECNLENIAIIGPVKLSKNGLSIGLNLICKFLHDNNINFIKHFKDPEENNINNKENIEMKKDHVNIFTSWGSKGLEFKKVLVINYHFHTKSKRPTEKEHNEHKYVWYVSISRAIENLIIYVDSEKNIFPEIDNVPKDLYTIEGTFKLEKINYDQERKPNIFSITKIINDNNYFSENKLLEFNEDFKYTIIKEELFDINFVDIYEYNKYSCLYGLFIEKLFTFYYYKNQNNITDFIDSNKKLLNNILFIDLIKYCKPYNSLKKLGYIDNNILNIDLIDKNILTNEEQQFVDYCYNKIKSNIINIFIKTNYVIYDKDYIVKLYDDLKNPEINIEKQIFDIILYKYQYENECGNLLKNNFSKHIDSLRLYYDKLNILSTKYTDLNFQVQTKHTNINLFGIIDILQNNKIIELKFVSTINEKHIIQLLLYYNNLFIDWTVEKNIEIWNLLDGYKYIIKFDSSSNINNWKLNCFMCKVLEIKMNNNIFILDLETNTMNVPFTIPSNNEIIERYIYEYNFNYVISEGLIKNKYKLVTSDINGIYEKDLLNADNNLDILRNDINNIMLYCNKPLFIAHNGKIFDFPILYYYKLLDKDKINELDSLHFIKLFINGKNSSNALNDLYNYVYNENNIQQHRAKEDVILIIKILKKLNLKPNDLIQMI